MPVLYCNLQLSLFSVFFHTFHFLRRNSFIFINESESISMSSWRPSVHPPDSNSIHLPAPHCVHPLLRLSVFILSVYSDSQNISPSIFFISLVLDLSSDLSSTRPFYRSFFCLFRPPFVCLVIRPYVLPSVRPSFLPSVHPSLCPVRPSVCQLGHLPVGPFVWPSVRPSTRRSVRSSIDPPVRPCVRLVCSTTCPLKRCLRKWIHEYVRYFSQPGFFRFSFFFFSFFLRHIRGR